MDWNKVDNWKNGWRKLVEWDKENKVYKYKGYDIYPLSYKEQYEMPLHLQNEYYWSEISRIENLVELKEKSSKQSQHDHFDFDKEWEEICEMLEW